MRLQKVAGSGDVDMPASYYLLTLAMVAIVAGIPFLYRVLWLLVYDSYKEIQAQKRGLDAIPGLERFGRPATRNLSKEFGKFGQKISNGAQQSGHAGTSSDEPWKVVAIYSYPIKSCFGIEHDEGEILETGFKYDRQFSFAQFCSVKASKSKAAQWDHNVPQWEPVTIRAHPALTRVKTEVWVPKDGLLDYEKEAPFIQSGGCVVGSFTFMPKVSLNVQGFYNLRSILAARLAGREQPTFYFRVPFKASAEQIEASSKADTHMVIWRDFPSAVDVGSSIPSHIKANLQAFLGVTNPLTLFHVHPSKPRNVFRNAPTASQLGYQAHVGFQDSYPLSLQNVASIGDMQARVPTTAAFTPDSRRYRANVYIAGPPPYDEDDWTLVDIGGRAFHCSCRTTRCKLPNTDPDSGARDERANEPQATMLKYRVIDEGSKSACLGMQVVPSAAAVGTRVAVGDEVKVVRRGKHLFVASIEPEDQMPIL